jgi:cyclophilin family peptidyl-prolyl cis-trans isomerase
LKRLLLVTMALSLVLALGCAPTKDSKETEKKTVVEEKVVEKKPQVKEEKVLVIETKEGKIVIELMPDLAPMHVERFTTLADEGFYNGCTFHRVIPGFMIQGGDPNSKDDNLADDGIGGSQLPDVTAEFSSTPHVKGIVSTARSSNPNSANSQFFIMHAANSGLNGKYTVWGKVIQGLEVVDKIVHLPPVHPGDRRLKTNPGRAAEMQKVYTTDRSKALEDADNK